ncbi:MAG TPA: hypothetical protein VJ761_05785, partial [Ktedonobacteraceae bacterium]|nr:hypothetical protein [Ktedonobacteraceae bacterium]
FHGITDNANRTLYNYIPQHGDRECVRLWSPGCLASSSLKPRTFFRACLIYQHVCRLRLLRDNEKYASMRYSHARLDREILASQLQFYRDT